MINRSLEKQIKEKTGSGKAIIILGGRQTGKTTLLRYLFGNTHDVLWLDGDEPDVRAVFDNPTSTGLKNMLGKKKILVLDEAQRIENIGLKLKLITDYIPGVQVIATGSSSFDLANKINEPLTGRKWEYRLFPLSFSELSSHTSVMEETRLLGRRIVYGSYPEVINNPGNEKEILKQLTDSFLYKDILMWEGLRKPEKIVRLLQLLAFQTGSEVSYNELGKNLDLDNQTVEKYIQLLEQTFVIFRMPALSRNLRKELKKSRKIYFYDNGIRNALIANFNPPELRNDTGALWENYFISERMKYLHYNNMWVNSWFWRTTDQQEIDYIEECDGKMHAFEIKWNTKLKIRISKLFLSVYPDSVTTVITPDNYMDFLR